MNASSQLYLDFPAHDFTESLPIGNGRLGACVYGEVLREQLVLNENSVWSGSREDADRPGAATHLPEIRRLLREGKNYEAQQLFEEHFTCLGKGTNFAHGTDVPFGCYQTLGRLMISYLQAVSSGRPDSTCIEDYRRILDIKKAICSVSFRLWGHTYTREYLVSADYQSIYIHLTCSDPGQIDFTCGLDRDECFNVEPLSGTSLHGLYMHGQLADGCGTDKGVRYGCSLGVVTKGGTTIQESLRVRVLEADEAWIILTARTDMEGFMGKQVCNPRLQTLSDLERAAAADWADVLSKHQAWYAPQFESMTVSIGKPESYTTDNHSITTKDRLLRSIQGDLDPSLATLYLQYARYLIICSSQPDGFAANLQGLWSDEILTPWNGDWHLNAQQMIYWLAERANLSAHHIPFLKLTEELVAPGEKTARTYYNARGWLAHTCTNPWGFTSPCEDASWGSTSGSPAWQCHHLWEHYLYTLDKEYLKWAYPIMKGAMLFYLDNMVENEKGWLVTSPSSSPENWFFDEQGRKCALCEGPAYDRALICALTDSCIRAGQILNQDSEFVQELLKLQSRLAPLEIGSDGRIMEWSLEYKEPYPYHRHLSHLWGVFPGNQVSREHTPEYAAAAEKVLQMRGITTAGWAIAFRGCLQARLRNGEAALKNFQDALKHATAYNLMNLAYHCDETLENPPSIDRDRSRYPFQIDGNQGNASILMLMLLDDDLEFLPDYSVRTHLYLLPAASGELLNGSLKGAKAKGNLTIDMDWTDGVVTHLRIDGPQHAPVVVHLNGHTCEVTLDQIFEWNL